MRKLITAATIALIPVSAQPQTQSGLLGSLAWPMTAEGLAYHCAGGPESGKQRCYGYIEAVIDLRAEPPCPREKDTVGRIAAKLPETANTSAHEAVVNAWTVTCR